MKSKLFLLVVVLSIALTQCTQKDSENLSPNFKTKQTWEVSISEAVNVASFAFENKKTSSNARLGSNSEEKTIDYIKTLKDREGDPLFYAINFKGNQNIEFGQGGGFVVVSADKRFIPILAKGEDGSFDPDTLLPGLDIWVDYIKTVYSRIKHKEELPNKLITHLWKDYEKKGLRKASARPGAQQYNPPIDYGCPEDTHATYGPLLNTRWNQSETYNLYTPSNGCSPCGLSYAGCGPVAIAQVWNYYEKPASYWGACGGGLPGGCQFYYNYPMPQARSGIFCDDDSATAGDREMAILIRQAGTAAQTDYYYFGTCNSLTWRNDVETAFYWANYSNDGNRVGLNSNLSTVNNELRNGHPMIIDGNTSFNFSNWHIWVIDGLEEFTINLPIDENQPELGCYGWGYSYYHLNWGWGNRHNENNWYALFNFTNHDNDVYDYSLHVTYGMRP